MVFEIFGMERAVIMRRVVIALHQAGPGEVVGRACFADRTQTLQFPRFGDAGRDILIKLVLGFGAAQIHGGGAVRALPIGAVLAHFLGVDRAGAGR